MVGGFLQEDTYRGDGLNLYAYCADNPVVYYDPSGQADTTITPVCGNGSNNAPENTRGAETGNSKSTISDESKSKWGKGTFDTVEDSLNHHYGEHGQEVGAGDIDQYVRKADGFRQNLRGSQKARPTNGTHGAIRYTKNGKYLLSFGR